MARREKSQGAAQVLGLLRNSGWSTYRIVEPAAGIDAIIEHDIVDEFDLDDPESLTNQIAEAVATFLGDIERFLAANDAR